MIDFGNSEARIHLMYKEHLSNIARQNQDIKIKESQKQLNKTRRSQENHSLRLSPFAHVFSNSPTNKDITLIDTLRMGFHTPVYDTEGVAKRKALDLFLYKKPKNDIEKEHNHETQVLADYIRSRRTQEYKKESYFTNFKKQLLSFLKKRTAEPSFTTPASSIDQEFILPSKSILKVTEVKEELSREYLTLEEINKILQTGREVSAQNKTIISNMIGLRWSDIETLRWEEMERPGKTEYKISLKKEKQAITKKQAEEAAELKELQDLQDENRRLRQMYNDLKVRVEKEQAAYVRV